MTSSRTAVRLQESHQPVLGVDVDVVGGFVEQQKVRAGVKNAGQFDAATLTTGQHAERQVDAVIAQTKTGDDLAHVGFGGVPALVGELLLRFG